MKTADEQMLQVSAGLHTIMDAIGKIAAPGASALAEAFDAGFTACASEHLKQRADPDYPITRVNPYR